MDASVCEARDGASVSLNSAETRASQDDLEILTEDSWNGCAAFPPMIEHLGPDRAAIHRSQTCYL